MSHLDRSLEDLLKEKKAEQLKQKGANRNGAKKGEKDKDTVGKVISKEDGKAKRKKDEPAGKVKAVPAPAASSAGNEGAKGKKDVSKKRPRAEAGAAAGSSGGGGGRGQAAKHAVDLRSSIGGGSKFAVVRISNLEDSVSKKDVSELAAGVGSVRLVKMWSTPRGQQIAEITFDSRATAEEAIKKYNGVPLDGKQLRLTLVTHEADAGATKKAQPEKQDPKDDELDDESRTRKRSRGQRSKAKRGKGAGNDTKPAQEIQASPEK